VASRKVLATRIASAFFDAFRRWGYLEATLDPLGVFEPLKHPDLDTLTGEAAEEARAIYCNTIGADFMHLPEPETPPLDLGAARSSAKPSRSAQKSSNA